MDWVAWPPGGYQVRGPRTPPRYTGPPSYPVPPRWGFPLVTWRRPTSFEPVPVSNRHRARSLAATAQPLLWLAAAICLLTAAAEIWRYTLLLDSRADAVPASQLRMSDALVVTGGVVSVLACGLSALVVLAWVVRAYPAAAELAGVEPSRSRRQLIAGWLVPGVNLSVPGSTLAELEHALQHPGGSRPATGAAPGRPTTRLASNGTPTYQQRGPARRPEPSALVAAWWAAWVASAVLSTVTLLWSLREGTQALADGVVLHSVADVLAATTAVLTAVVVHRFTVLLRPAVPGKARRRIVVRVGPADASPGGASSAGASSSGASSGGMGPGGASSGGDGKRGQPADHELRAPGRLAGQPQPG